MAAHPPASDDTAAPAAARPVVTWWHPSITDYRQPLFARMARAFDLRLHLLHRGAIDPPPHSQAVYSRARRPAVLGNPLRLPLADAWALARSIRTSDVFVTSFSANAYTLFGLLCARLAGVPVVVWEEMQRIPQHGRQAGLKRRLLRWTAQRVDAYFVMGEPQRHLLQWLGVEPARIFVSAEAPALRYADVPAAAVDLPFNGDRPVVLFVGRLITIKGVGVLLKAFATVQRWLPDAALVIAGDGAERRVLEAQAQRLGLKDTVFLGHVAEPARKAWLLQRAGVLAVPSVVLGDWAEGGPLVIPEALSAGTPVVCTAACGNTVGHVQRTGFGSVVPPDDAGALATALAHWLVHAPERASVVGASRAEPDHDHQAATLTRAIRSALRGPHTPPAARPGASLWTRS